jgi:hypothetical protein
MSPTACTTCIPAASLQHPCSIPAASLQHPCSIPAASLQHPCSIPAASLQHPCSSAHWMAVLDGHLGAGHHTDAVCCCGAVVMILVGVWTFNRSNSRPDASRFGGGPMLRDRASEPVDAAAVEALIRRVCTPNLLAASLHSMLNTPLLAYSSCMQAGQRSRAPGT